MISIDYRVERSDWVAFVRLASKRATGWLYGLLAATACLLVLASPIVAAKLGPPDFNQASFIQGVSVTLLIWLTCRFVFSSFLQSHYLNDDWTILGDRHLDLSDAKVEMTGKHSQASYDWAVVQDITQTKNVLVIWVEPAAGIIVPRRAFKNFDEVEAFIEYVRQRINRAKR